MGDAAQVLKAVAFFLQWIIRRGFANHYQFGYTQLKLLSGSRGGDQRAGCLEGGAGVELAQAFKVREIRPFQHQLDAGQI